MDSTIKDKSIALLQFLEQISGCNVKELKEQSSFSGKIGAYLNARDLFDIDNYVQNKEYAIAFEKGISFLKKFISEVRFSYKIEKLIDECAQMGQILTKAHDFFESYSLWMAEERSRFREYLFNNEFLKEEEKTEEFLDKFNYEWVDLVKKSVQEKSFQIYNFRECTDTFLQHDHALPYYISDALCISDDIYHCISFNKNLREDKCFARLSLKIDHELAFSYFIITVQYKDRVWIATDKPSFVNPRSKQTTRNPYRWRSETFENTQLPYGILNDIEKWRKESKEITNKNNSEIYIKSIKDYLPPVSKILIKLIIEELIYNIIPKKQYELQKIGYANESINLIGSDKASMNIEDDGFIGINKEANDSRIDDIVYPPSSEIIEVNPTNAVMKYVDTESLYTVDEMRKLAIWSQKEEQRRIKQRILDNAYTGEKIAEDEEKLNKIIFDNLENLYQIIFSAEQVFMCIEDDKTKTFGKPLSQPIIIKIFDSTCFKSSYSDMMLTNYNEQKNKKIDQEARCVVCNSERPTNLVLNIYSYKELVGILNVERDVLPYTFQNFTAHQYVPYYGNYILRNVNPEYLIIDPFSKRYQNGYRIGIPLNKRCYNKLRKKYWKHEKSLVIINYTKRSIQIKKFEDDNN